MTIFNVFTLMGGIAMFLYGMDLMGKALEQTAGSNQHRRIRCIDTNLPDPAIGKGIAGKVCLPFRFREQRLPIFHHIRQIGSMPAGMPIVVADDSSCLPQRIHGQAQPCLHCRHQRAAEQCPQKQLRRQSVAFHPGLNA